jgi:hypothetical protein
MRFLILPIDRHLRRKLGVFEFSDDPECLFRARVTNASRDLQLHDHQVSVGEPILELHLWNEHLRPVSNERLGILRWGVNSSKQLASSCRALARFLHNDSGLDGIRAVGGTTGVFSAGEGSGWEGVLARVGFTITPHDNPKGSFSEFWERVYAWMLMRAVTVGARRPPRLREIRRADFWMTAEEFVRRHGDGIQIESKPARTGEQVQST